MRGDHDGLLRVVPAEVEEPPNVGPHGSQGPLGAAAPVAPGGTEVTPLALCYGSTFCLEELSALPAAEHLFGHGTPSGERIESPLSVVTILLMPTNKRVFGVLRKACRHSLLGRSRLYAVHYDHLYAS